MGTPHKQSDDPLAWCIGIALAFFAFALIRLGMPSTLYFDEIHYVKAARALLELSPANREHPMFAKEVIAASIALFGDKPIAWRLPSLLFGTVGLFAFGRMMWRLSQQRIATILAMVLLATNFMWFIISRIAMLDIFAASLILVALWQFSIALDSDTPRRNLLLTGVALGCALGAKWSIALLAMLPGLAVLYLRITHKGSPDKLRGVSLIEAALWLGLLPLIAYWLTYAPAFFYATSDNPISPFGFIEHHQKMLELQDSVTKSHTYQSVWWQWIFNYRPIWFLYEPIDGAQRGILLVGNPLTMLLGLPAFLWSLWAGIFKRRHDALILAILYVTSLALWPFSGKPIQFYFHYLLPGTFLMGCLALALSDMWSRSQAWRTVAAIVILGTIGLFAWFYPIISAAELTEGRPAYVKWMWLNSWR